MAKKSSYKQMRMVAEKLPANFTEGIMTITGGKILEHKPTAKDAEGNPVDEKKLYKIPVQYNVNHYKRIKKIFKAMGYKGVDQYVNELIDLEAETKVNHAKFLAANQLM